jgi:hypothetical protein
VLGDVDAHDDRQVSWSGWLANEAVEQDGQHGGDGRDGQLGFFLKEIYSAFKKAIKVLHTGDTSSR